MNRIRSENELLEKFQILSAGGQLKKIPESIQKLLENDEETNPRGLPVILLARLPHQLIDVLILMESQRPQQEESSVSLPAFVLYWLLFVADSEKAANMVFRRFSLKEADWQPLSDMKLIRHFEEQGISRRLPGEELLGKTRNDIRCGSHLLRTWGDRFAVLDANKDHPSGDALRALSTHGELIRCALLWLQRKYLSDQFPNYEPTSSRDEDLPIDLDHLIPHNKFGVDWRRQQNCLSFQSPDEKENFHHLRWTVGNSLGNFRWLNASDNRGRQDGQIEETDRERNFIDDIPRWNDLIEKNVWTEKDVAAFQELIDLRSIKIYETLLCNGLNAFVSVAPQSKDKL